MYPGSTTKNAAPAFSANAIASALRAPDRGGLIDAAVSHFRDAGDYAGIRYHVFLFIRSTGHPGQVARVPKTVDNDLSITDNCPGFGAVAEYIATDTLPPTPWRPFPMCAL